MQRSSVIVANKNHVIFFALEEGERNNPNVESRLVERSTLKNTALERLENAEKTDTRRGDYPTAGSRNSPTSMGSFASVGGFAARSSMSDAENAEERHALQQFARGVIERTEEIVAREKPDNLVLVAGPEMLGVLRAELSIHPLPVRVREVQKSLARMKTHEIHDALAREDVLPARRSQTGAAFSARTH
jgi:protein required for attachment to host cells